MTSATYTKMPDMDTNVFVSFEPEGGSESGRHVYMTMLMGSKPKWLLPFAIIYFLPLFIVVQLLRWMHGQDDVEVLHPSRLEAIILAAVFSTALSIKLLIGEKILFGHQLIRLGLTLQNCRVTVAAFVMALNLIQPLVLILFSVYFALFMSETLMDALLNFLAFEFISSLDDAVVNVLVDTFFADTSIEVEISAGLEAGHLDEATARDLVQSDMPNTEKVVFLVSGELQVRSVEISTGRIDPPASYWFSQKLKPEDVEFLTVPRWSRLSLKQKQSLWVGADEKQRLRLQRFVLCDLYDITNGPSWRSQIGWKQEDVPLAHWEGVQCDQDGWVVNIQMGSYGLLGPLPPLLSKLEKLKDLDLTNNGVSDFSVLKSMPSLHSCKKSPNYAKDALLELYETGYSLSFSPDNSADGHCIDPATVLAGTKESETFQGHLAANYWWPIRILEVDAAAPQTRFKFEYIGYEGDYDTWYDEAAGQTYLTRTSRGPSETAIFAVGSEVEVKLAQKAGYAWAQGTVTELLSGKSKRDPPKYRVALVAKGGEEGLDYNDSTRTHGLFTGVIVSRFYLRLVDPPNEE